MAESKPTGDNVFAFKSRYQRDLEKAAQAQETTATFQQQAELQAEAYGPPVPIDIASFARQFYATSQKEGHEKRQEQIKILYEFNESLERACANRPVVVFATTLNRYQDQSVMQLIERHGICDEAKIENARSNWYQTNDRDLQVAPMMLGFEDLDIAVCPYLSDGRGGWRINENIEPLYIPVGAIVAINFENKPGPRLSAV